jgi:uncharacterized protein YhaN
MKLSKLLLQAFGPFTDVTLDFGAGPAHLHLIYGPNEAGKSSALRAMADLRFGIPARSPDDFVHPFGQMRVGGVFLDEQGEAVGLLRRKGRGDTLSRLDPVSGLPEPGLPVRPGHALALTGGLERGAFEAMYGLNHARLRQGGDLLLKGEGEMGAALFEASAGARGIAAILAELDADAKKLLNPHGSAKTAVINEARRQLDEQRHALRQAQTKPAEWHSLHRAHEAARAALEEIDQNLEACRRRENELTEWRTVEPLLREHDRVLADWEGLADAPDLPEDAREQRLAAEQALRHAGQERQDAEAESARCAEALAALAIEPALLEHAEAVERLAAAVDGMQRSRLEIRQQQAALAPMQAELAAAVARLGPGAEDLARSLPTAAGRAELGHHLDAVAQLGERLAAQRQQAEKLEQAAALGREEDTAPPDPARRRALAVALRQAQALGDVERQSAEFERQGRALDGQLARALADLGLASAEALDAARPLLDAEIAETRQALADLDQAARTLRDEDGRLRRDLEEQRLRLGQLAAAGEVVTADTLRQARARRDESWRQGRRAHVDGTGSRESGRAWADGFEAALAEADRQADVLRIDAKRAASVEECAARIGQMERRQGEIAAEIHALAGREAARRDAWARRLAQAGLPALPPEALREWQSLRLDALQLAERRADAQAAHQRLQAEAGQAAAALGAALRGAGQPPAASLPGLLAQALAWETAATEAQAKHEERAKAARLRAAEREETARRLAATEAELARHREKLGEWHGRLLLPPDSPPAAVKARLDELNALARQAAALAEARLRLAQGRAWVDEFAEQARQLARLLGEPLPAQPEDFAERLRARLNLSKEAALQRKNLESGLAKAGQRRSLAEAGHARQADILARLCQAAGVAEPAQLPGREARAEQKRQAGERLDGLRRQLALASALEPAQLRERLAGRDAVGLDAERERCKAETARLEQAQAGARLAEEEARRALEAVDDSDRAARAREAMEAAAARYRAALKPWARLRLAHALLAEALNRFRERAQAPMVAAASDYFALMTCGRYERLAADDADGKPVLRALRPDGVRVGVEAMSEGTADQLYLALRLAALDLRRAAQPAMPLVLDDVLVTSDDARAANILRALARFAEGGQVMLFTHHRHLIELALSAVPDGAVAVHCL